MDSYPDYPGKVDAPAGEDSSFAANGEWVEVSFVGSVLTQSSEEVKIRLLSSDRGAVGFGVVTLNRKAWREAEVRTTRQPIHFAKGDLYRVNLTGGGHTFIIRNDASQWHSATTGSQTSYTDEEIANAVHSGQAVKLEEKAL